MDESLKLNPDFLESWGIKGKVLNELGRDEEALICFDKVLNINPNDLNGWYKKGQTLMKLNRNAEALKCFDKALELDPTFEPALKAKEDILDSKS